MELQVLVRLAGPEWRSLSEALEPLPDRVGSLHSFLARQEPERVRKRPLKQRSALFVRVVVGCRGSVLGLRMVAGYPPRAVLVPG